MLRRSGAIYILNLEWMYGVEGLVTGFGLVTGRTSDLQRLNWRTEGVGQFLEPRKMWIEEQTSHETLSSRWDEGDANADVSYGSNMANPNPHQYCKGIRSRQRVILVSRMTLTNPRPECRTENIQPLIRVSYLSSKIL